MKGKMKKEKKIILIVALLIAIVAGAFAIYKVTSDKKSEEIQKETDKKNEEVKNSKESIKELNKELEKKLNTEFEDKIDIDYFEGSTNIELQNDGGILYITAGSYKSKVTDIDESIVQIVDAKNSCSLTSEDILILTEKGNLYKLAGGNTEQRLNKNIIAELKANKDVKLNLEKINNTDELVLGITVYYHYESCSTCGSGPVAIYTNREKYRLYDSLEEIVDFEAKITCP